MNTADNIGPRLGGLDSPQVEPGTIVRKTIEFVRSQLPRWRDDPHRDAAVTAENDLNAQLCKFLNVSARRQFSMVHFHSEERQAGMRRVDLSALPVELIRIGPRSLTYYEPFLVIEGKRLPAPSNDREREYVIGENQNGGIQRFKLGLHGAALDVAIMIAYIQDRNPSFWHDTVNGWIRELPAEAVTPGESWPNDEQLQGLAVDAELNTSVCESDHHRNASTSDRIHLHHLWVEMNL